MKRSKSNFLQMKKESNKKYKSDSKISNIVSNKRKNKNYRYVERKIKDNKKDVRVIEITPRLSTIDLSEDGLSFNEKVDIVANKMKEEIMQLHEQGYGVRFIGQQLDISRELARSVIKGTGSLRIIAMQRVRFYEFQTKKN